MDPFLGMIRAFAFQIVPKGWAACNGQLLPINQNQALYSLLGTTYGGDGRLTFALPDLRGRAIVGVGTGPGLASVSNGQVLGANTVTVSQSQMPQHTHQVVVSSAQANTDSSGANTYAKTNDPAGSGADLKCYGPVPSNPVAMSPTIQAGSSQPVNVQNPFLGINYCISIQGIFPSRS